MKNIIRALAFLERNLLYILSIFLLAFIPLFPKIPIADILPGYIVRLRAEDLLIGLTLLIWLKDVFLKRIKLNTDLFWLISVYAFVGLTSIILGAVFQQTIPFELLHIGKSGLHWFRYLEYFSLFFFLYGSIRNKFQIKLAIFVLLLTVLGIVGYGFGQKYLHFPLYSTMNREYSKGQQLFLQPGARVQSTFAGHYDLAGFLILVLPVIFSISFIKISKNKILRVGYFLAVQAVHLSGLWLLIESDSKTALVAYAIGIGLIFVVHWWQLSTLRLKLATGLGATVFGLIAIFGVFTVLPPATQQAYLGIISSKLNTQTRPVDLTGSSTEYKLVASTSASGTTYSVPILTNKEWSENALKYGLSIGIRLDTLWPRAIRGFGYNPLTGAGYGTLASLDTALFAEADSTDNNYLRILGETGLLGFLSFLAIVGTILVVLAKNFNHRLSLLKQLSIGLFAGTISLLLDGALIDVFAASKIAFVFWALAGLALKLNQLVRKDDPDRYWQLIRRHFSNNWAIYSIIILATLSFHQNIFRRHNLTKNFVNQAVAIQEITQASCFFETGRFELCRPNGLVRDANFSVYSWLLNFVNQINYHPSNYFALNLLILSGLFGSFWLTAKRSKFSQTQILVGSLALLLGGYLLKISYQPLQDTQLLILVGVAALTGFSFKFLPHLKNKKLLTFLSLGLFLALASSGFAKETVTRFRFKGELDSLRLIENANAFFKDMPNQPVLISQINPYYADQFANRRWQLLPISEHQLYFEHAPNVWGNYDYADLDALYANLIESGPLFITNFTSDASQSVENRINQLREKFNLNHRLLGCSENCNIYQISQYTDPINKPMLGLNNRVFDPDTLPNNYQISIFSLRYPEPAKNLIYSTTHMAQELMPTTANKNQLNLFTGDLTHTDGVLPLNLLTRQLLNKYRSPVIFNPGNLVTRPKASGQVVSFFTPTDYFLILDFDQSHLNFAQLQLELYDKFFEMEKLPNLQNIIVVNHDLNWHDTNNPNSLLPILENKLAKFETANSYIITGNLPVDENETGFMSKSEDNIHYYASQINGSETDAYLNLTSVQGKIEIESESLTPTLIDAALN